MEKEKLPGDFHANCAPIILGITGHRDLVKKDEPQLKSAIRRIIENIKQEYPYSPVKLLSSLAEGADSLAADVALECGVPVIAPLPMPVEEYEKDFSTRQSKEELRRLISGAESSFVVPDADGNASGDPDYANNRNHYYGNAGMYLARHSHILIALWDGVQKNNGCGTSETVRYKLEGDFSFSKTEEQGFFIIPDRGPVYHIITPRKSNVSPAGKHFSQKKLYFGMQTEDLACEKAIREVLYNIDQYNKDVQALSKRLEKGIEESKSFILDSAGSSRLHDCQKRLLDAYAVADRMSVYFRGKRFASLRLLSGIGLLLVVLFLLYDELESNLMLPLYILSFAVVCVLFLIASRKGYQNKYVDYRALAEGLKVQFYWSICDMNLNASEHYNFGQRDELTWVRYAITAYSLGDFSPREPMDLEWSFTIVDTFWTKGQNRYFKKTAIARKKHHNRQESIVNILFVSSLVVILIVSLLEFGFKGLMGATVPVDSSLQGELLTHVKVEAASEYQELFIRSIFKIILALIVAVMAFVNNYNSKLALSEQVRNYIVMGKLFEIAEDRLGTALRENNYSRAKKILFELGREALVENAGWVILYKERPLELPK